MQPSRRTDNVAILAPKQKVRYVPVTDYFRLL